LALGADAYEVLLLILNRLVPVLLTGLVAGTGLYLAGGRYLQSILYGVTVSNARAIAIALTSIGSVSFACGTSVAPSGSCKSFRDSGGAVIV